MSVSDVLQDKYGFMWMATDDGLSMYDGYTCTNSEMNRIIHIALAAINFMPLLKTKMETFI